MLLPPLERFLNRVMIMARREMRGTDEHSERLRNDISMFVQQEGQHYAIHTTFNAMLERSGFTKLPAMEAAMEEEYKHLVKSKSLRFLCAYCDGFETLGPIFARIYLDQLDEYYAGGDPNVVAMWKWHLMEEYEHRTVCFDVYEHLYGDYFMRIYGLLYAFKHMGAYVKKVRTYMLERECADMSSKERAATKARFNAGEKRIGRLALPHLLGIFSPSYTPRAAPPPVSLERFERQLQQDFLA